MAKQRFPTAHAVLDGQRRLLSADRAFLGAFPVAALGVTLDQVDDALLADRTLWERLDAMGDADAGFSDLAIEAGERGARFSASRLSGGAWGAGAILLAVEDLSERARGERLDVAGHALQRANRELEERLRERTAQLDAANKELKAFTYAISHDLRAPLRAIDGFAVALAEDAGTALPEAARDHLERLRASAARMRVLIDDMLRLSQVARVELFLSDVDLSALATEVTDELRRGAPQRQVEVAIAPGLRAHGDPTLLRTVLEHLLGNAWKYTGKRSLAHIALGATAENGGPVFFVRDDGAGFNPEYTHKLFRPFQRLHSRDDFDGTGVGLATVHRIVERHGGRVWAEGAVDGGATLYFTLPG